MSMRKRARAALIVAMLAPGLSACPAQAHELPVFDASNLAQAVSQLRQLEQQLEVLKQQYQALAHLPTGVTGIAPSLSAPGLRTPLPPAASLPDILSGRNPGQVGPSVSDFAGRNRYAAPNGDDWAAQELRRRSQATAGVQAMAMQAVQAVEQRQAALAAFMAEIGGAPDVQQSVAIQNRLVLEGLFIQGQQTQAAYLQVMLRSQEQVDQQRVEERRRQDYQGLIDRLRSQR